MNHSKKAKLTEGPVGRLLAGMTVPMFFGVLGLVIFTLVDTFFIGKLGTLELAAISFTFPVVMVLGSFTLGLGEGVSSVISRSIGSGNHHKVQELTTDSLIMGTVLGVVFAASGFLTVEPLFRALGAHPDVMPLVKKYMYIWYSGVILMPVSMIGNNAIRATGDIKTPTILMLVAIVVNLALDPLLIFGMGPFPEMGIGGAALAAVIARVSAVIWALVILLKRDDLLPFFGRPFGVVAASIKPVLYLGVPAACTRIIMPVASGIIVKMISGFGPEAVAGYGVSSRVEFFALTVVVSLSTVLGPFIGQNWGAGKKERALSGIGISKKFSMIWGFGMIFVLGFLARPIAGIFNDDPVFISTVTAYLRIVPVGYGLFGILIITAMTLTVINKPFYGTGLMATQMLVLCLPMAYIGERFFGINGIFISISLAYVLSGILANRVLKYVLGQQLKN
ncbi:MAG: MATE family efflux transporter [Candidatus Omnitrophica bacterium]|nr:MATE family efflux transporter [Candidatus Omnitrophota bacterium]